ncbi:magnesium/cobalt transporter CorA [Rubripirellula amarantea]|uniref:Magnesium transport protein CorA n=1 Tax=Rubripirellula amarantea TaxID=2527999 RepID=A0A5C5WRY0_9BACT|nr:magnesium/cobalt transporter CorA [Rubripirellula amarantea]MDA8744446.1 magnesium/cobalt transporter CorA [Rubripirellula amarantea]TWT53327.1 Magnesium transport protein CorA [Rubripirellula amarantea]
MKRKRFANPFRRKRKVDRAVGLAPGTISIADDAVPTSIRAIRFNRSEVKRFENLTVEEIPLASSDHVVWVDVVGLGDEPTISAIGKRFKIHALSLEDVVNTHQRPKIEVYDDHLYIVVRMPSSNGQLDLEQVSLFVGNGYVVSWQEREGDCFNAVRKRLESSSREVRRHGSDFLAYALVDTVVDAFFPHVHHFGDALDQLEDEIADQNRGSEVVHQIFEIRSDIRRLRRVAWSHREMIQSWLTYNGPLTGEATRLHLRDVADHTIRVVELLEMCRESCSDLRDLQMSAASMRMNEVMKVLTVIATIFIPLSFIAGLYGMNFSTQTSPWNMPETQWYFGYPFALFLMSLVAGGMVVFFYRKRWIG